MNETTFHCSSNHQTLLPFFPIPYEGETVYSVLSRYLMRSAETNSHVLKKLTRQREKSPFFAALPGHLHRIAELMPEGHPWQDPREIVNRHTTLSYLTYFDSQIDRDRFQAELATSDSSSSITMKLGLSSYKCGAKVTSPRYCPVLPQSELEKQPC